MKIFYIKQELCYMWKYTSENDYPNIILHDCYIVKATVEDNDLIIEFKEHDFLHGFWINEINKQNPFGKTLRTDKALIRFVNFDFDSIYIFKTICLFRRFIFTRRVEVSFEKFIENLNIGKWQFEFIDEFYAGNYGALFNGWVYFNDGKSHYDCQIQLRFTKMVYSWNKICEDKPW